MLEGIAAQEAAINRAAEWFCATILAGRMVHAFGSGHDRVLVEEMWPRYGSFPGFNPIAELSLCFYNHVVGSNGYRQAAFLEHSPGLAERILRNFEVDAADSALVVSSSGCSAVAIEMAAGLRARGVKVVSIVSRKHLFASVSRHHSGKKLTDYSDITLDNMGPIGDAIVRIPGLEAAVAPASTVGGCMLINAVKAQVAAQLVAAGHTPPVLTSSAIVGRERARELFERAYDEHAHRLARLLDRGATSDA
jgi:uncharacterized phosphosugar-binding protein